MPLTNKTCSVNTVFATLLWTLGSLLVLADFAGLFTDDTGMIGMCLVAGGHLLCMCALSQRVVKEVEREREAFEYGRRYEQTLRSV